MADEKSNSTIDDHGVLTIGEGVSATTLDDLIQTKFVQLEAAVHMTFASSGESFRGFNDSIQDNFMWLISDKVTELKALYEAMQRGQPTA